MGYSTNMKTMLATHGLYGMTANLVDVNDGSSLIPDGVSKYVLITKKGDVVNNSTAYSQDSGATWGNTTRPSNITDNTVTPVNSVGALNLISYTSSNAPLVQTDILPITSNEDKVLMSNSHSLYKGAGLTNLVTGGIATGNGNNGLESKVLENDNNINGYTHYAIQDSSLLSFEKDDLIRFGTGFNKIEYTFDYIYRAKESNAFYLNINLAWYPNILEFIGVYSTPKHQTPTLDNSDSKASKSFGVTMQEDNRSYTGVVANAIIYDTSWGDDGEFQVSNGTKVDSNTNNTKTGIFKTLHTPFIRKDK